MILRILFFSFFISSFVFGQTDNPVQDLDIQILSPKLDKNIPASTAAKLERKVINVFTQNDVVNKKESTFTLEPFLSLIEFGKLEGISSEETVQLELHFMVKNVFSGQSILVFSHKLSGSGKSKNVAINRAINNIRPQRKVYASFIARMQEKVDKYYGEDCNNIIASAQTAIDQNEYQKAIAILYAIPKKSDCRVSNQALLDQTYRQFQAQGCQALIQKAEVAILKKDYKDAINLIGQVDPNSPCKDQAQQLLQTVTAKVDEQTAKKMDFLNKVYKDNVDIEKARQQSMKSISNTYIEGIKKD